jgi:hypothetical protein
MDVGMKRPPTHLHVAASSAPVRGHNVALQRNIKNSRRPIFPLGRGDVREDISSPITRGGQKPTVHTVERCHFAAAMVLCAGAMISQWWLCARDLPTVIGMVSGMTPP